MKAFKGKVRGTCAGLLLVLATGMPVLADDTELMLVNPSTASQNKPNILFILDTSGSMDTVVTTTEPYDSSVTYSGPCDVDHVYWTELALPPVCDSANTKYIEQSYFVCNLANQQMLGIGSYSGIMVQYRQGTTGGAAKWQYIEAGFNSEYVECEADSGVHGDGTSGYVYASKGADLSYPFTNDSQEELSWGSSPRNRAYTFFDGNYLNWKANPVAADLERIDIVKDVTTAVLKSVTNVNVGVMRFNYEHGGPVIRGLSDLDTNRADILATIDSLDADGYTPLAETMYEAALYWRGLPSEFGEDINEHATDPAVLSSTEPEVYSQPQTNVCSKNYNVLLTDGVPVRDDEAQALAPTLPGFQAQLNRTSCNGTIEMGMCLDDITEYLGTVDIDSTQTGDQFVTTHTIGFAIDLPILRNAAEISDGRYFLADDVESLANVLLDIVADISERNLSFAAPAVSVNAFNRTQHLNDLYVTVFSPKARLHWPGNLKKYRIDNGMVVDANNLGAVNPATGFFDSKAVSFWGSSGADGNVVTDGGAANQLPAPTSRKLYTNNGFSNDLTTSSNAIALSNASSFTPDDFGLSGVPGEPTVDEMIRWLRGEDITDIDADPKTTVRNQMGDPLHSQPASIVYGGSATSPEAVVYAATNDGYLHAIDAETGVELWSFIPQELLKDMSGLFFNTRSKYKRYGIDGNIVPVVADRNKNGIIDGSDFVYIVFGMRRGGSSFYALDVTDKNSPELLWIATDPEFGQSWSTPVVARINIDAPGQNADDAVVIIGGGYDSVHDSRSHPTAPDAEGASIHMLDLVSGAELWRAGRGTSADLRLSSMTRAIPSQIRAIDLSGDGMVNRLYASDLGGQLLRFDVLNGEPPSSLVTGGVIAQLGAEALTSPTDADTRRFYNSPDVSIFTDLEQNRRYVSLSIGSGYRAHPLDNGASDRFYSVRDPDVYNRLPQSAYDTYNIATDADMVEVGGSVRTAIPATARGWKFTLSSNQKVITNSATFDNSVYFLGFSPEANLSDVCEPSQGRNFLYQLRVENGDPVVTNISTLLAENADGDRVRVLKQGGIAPTPAFLFPSPTDPSCNGAACSPSPIGCVGVECFNPGFANTPVRTLWTQDGIE